ncbi:ribonuclease H-like domain-containing protein [Tanacetum coccineum]
MHQPPGFTDLAHSDYVCLLQKLIYGLKQPPKLGFSDFPAMLFELVSITKKLTYLFSSFTRGQTRLTYYCMWMISFLQLLLLCSCNVSSLRYMRNLLWQTLAHSTIFSVYLPRILPLAYSCLRRNMLSRFLSGHRCLIVTLAGLQLTLRRSLDLKDHRSLVLLYIASLPEHFRTTNLGLQLFRSTTSQLIAYSDADWAGYPATCLSTFRYCVFLGDNLLTWSSKCQDTLSRSSAEAEYHGIANVVAETSWIRNLLRELHTPTFHSELGLL